ncbi:MAG: Methyltransferase type 11 [Mucilaginibacter sp.]|nr:Methyltransferase type 11 [Mucilaginibacter sp.]
MKDNLPQTFGNIDIYLFDQLLKGRYNDCKKIIDVGCANGRNLFYFLRNGYEVFGVDPNVIAVNSVKELSAALAPDNPLENFIVGNAEDLPYPDASFDLVISSAVLHFAQNKKHFDAMLRSMFRVLKPGGYFFARLASVIGIETLIKDLGNNRFLLPDGSERFLVDEQTLLQYTNEVNGRLYEPIKTTNVQNLRCMTTWCVQKLH